MDGRVRAALSELSEESLEQVSGGRSSAPPDPEMLPAGWHNPLPVPPGPGPGPSPGTPFQNIDWNKALQDGAWTPPKLPPPRRRRAPPLEV
jgi:hypothetical protein